MAFFYAAFPIVALLFWESMAFKITGISPMSGGVTVWTDTSGADQNVRLSYTVTELFPTDLLPPAPLSGTLYDLRSSFNITGLKAETWYGLHLSSAYSWRGSQHIDPAHDVAFKTLSDFGENASRNGTADTVSTPITIAARPIAGGFQLLVMNRLGDRLRSPMDAYVTSTCAGEPLGGRYRFTSDQPPRQTKDFLLNNTKLPESISTKAPSQWAVDACHTVCWSLFVNAANLSYVLDTQCTNLTEVFINTGSDNALWDRSGDNTEGGESSVQHSKDELSHGSGGTHSLAKGNTSSIQKRSDASSFAYERSYHWLITSIVTVLVMAMYFS